MASISPPVCDFGWPAPAFTLPGVDGRTYTLADVQGPKGTLVMFICNHCPYVKAILPRLLEDCRLLAEQGIGCVAICSNDASTYPEDSFAAMQALSRELNLPFPYLHDESQTVAQAWGAVCTPDFFGLNAELQLQYRGRFDASTKLTAPPDARRELREAMLRVAATGQGPQEQTASIGCSIKWKADLS